MNAIQVEALAKVDELFDEDLEAELVHRRPARSPTANLVVDHDCAARGDDGLEAPEVVMARTRASVQADERRTSIEFPGDSVPRFPFTKGDRSLCHDSVAIARSFDFSQPPRSPNRQS